MESTIPSSGIKNVDDCVQWLDSVLLGNEGTFKYSRAVKKLKAMFELRRMDSREYLELVEACACRQMDGHYRNSYVYQFIEGRILR